MQLESVFRRDESGAFDAKPLAESMSKRSECVQELGCINELLLFDALCIAIVNLGCEIVSYNGEADDSLPVLARARNGIVLSDDSDFLVSNCFYVNLRRLEWDPDRPHDAPISGRLFELRLCQRVNEELRAA